MYKREAKPSSYLYADEDELPAVKLGFRDKAFVDVRRSLVLWWGRSSMLRRRRNFVLRWGWRIVLGRGRGRSLLSWRRGRNVLYIFQNQFDGGNHDIVCLACPDNVWRERHECQGPVSGEEHGRPRTREDDVRVVSKNFFRSDIIVGYIVNNALQARREIVEGLVGTDAGEVVFTVVLGLWVQISSLGLHSMNKERTSAMVAAQSAWHAWFTSAASSSVLPPMSWRGTKVLALRVARLTAAGRGIRIAGRRKKNENGKKNENENRVDADMRRKDEPCDEAKRAKVKRAVLIAKNMISILEGGGMC